MKRKRNRLLAGLLAVTMTTSMLFSNAALVSASGDTLPPRPGEQGYKGENQPVYHGYRAMDILNWTPESDEFSDFMRARVPLQERNEAFAATQANPLLDQEVESLTLAGDYGNNFFNGDQYNDEFAQYVFNFWQYLDYRASWHGMVTNPTPDSLFDPEAEWWEREYEFGILNLPNPAYTNAAHKNGVKSLGCIFFPRSEHTDTLVYKDETGRFPMADKLVEIAKYYGFDGYFVNAEEALPADFMPVYEEFLRQMTEQGIYIQTYASNQYGQNNQGSWGQINYYNKDATLFSNWVKGTDDETVASNSLYMNPDPSKDMVNGSVSIMESLGLDARKTVFNTLEAGQTGFSGKRGSLYNTLDENLVPRTALASLGTEHVWSGIDENMFGHTGAGSYEENRRGDPDYQKYVFARERTWWSGSNDQPYYANTTLTEEQLQAVLDVTTNPYTTANDPDRGSPDEGTDNEGKPYQAWPGLAAFISERSVIDGTNFYTNFNTGHGMQYFANGKVSNDHEWANINIQDILPTWQWWSQTADDSAETLRFDFDYGEKYSPAFELNQIGGYDGGSSLVAKGSLSVEHLLRLYKTKLGINDNSELGITYYKSTADDASEMKVALIFEDAPETVEYVTVPNSGKQSSDWTKATIDLSKYAGRTLAAFGLAFDPNGESIADYQMNVGEMTITDNQNAPAAPTGLTIDKAFNTSETYISWDLASYDDVQKYNVYAVYEDGSEVYLGGTYDDVYYIKNLYNPSGVVTIKVTAEGANGVESEAAEVSRDFDKEASSLKTEPANGYVSASWENPSMDYASIRAEITLPYNYAGNTETYTETFAKDAVSGIVSVPVADGSNYTLRLSYLDADGNVLSYTDCSGQLKDLYCESYKGSLYNSIVPGKGVTLENPQVYDWWHLYAWKSDGSQITFKDGSTFAIRGVDDLTGMPVGGFDYIEVQLEDFAGNKSEKVRVYYGAEGKEVDESLFPDPVLREAVRTQVGTTLDKVIAFDGTLDLSGKDVKDFTGLSYFEHLDTLDLSGCGMTTLKKGMLDGAFMRSLKLNDCSALTVVEPDALSNVKGLKEIDITGSTALQVLGLNNTTLETIIYGDASTYTSLVSLWMDNARFDLSEGTPEQVFADTIAKQAEGKDDVVIKTGELVNLSPNATVVAEQTTLAGAEKLFDGNTTSPAYFMQLGDVVVKFDTPQVISKWTFFSTYQWNAMITDFELQYSVDGVEWKTAGEAVTGCELEEYSKDLSIEAASYFKFKAVKGAGGWALASEVALYGEKVITYAAGVTTNDQRPVCYEEIPESVAYELGEGMVDPASIPTYKTVRGNSFAALADASFVAEDYDVAAQMVPQYDMITVDGNVNTQISLENDAVYTVSFVKFGESTTQKNVTVTVGDPELANAREALSALIKTAESIDRSLYTEESLAALDKAVANAKEVLAQNASIDELNAAYDALEAALNALEENDGENTDTEQPDTGDNTALVFPICLTVIALTSALLFVQRKRKEN